MRRNQSSLTAAGIAIVRALESEKPEGERTCYDQKALGLVVGTILAKGRRTVTRALRALGHTHTSDRVKYDHVLNRARRSGLRVSRLLLAVRVATWRLSDQVTIAVDEMWERRRGPQIRRRGQWRDSLASSRQVYVSSSGLRGSCLPWPSACPGRRMRWPYPFSACC